MKSFFFLAAFAASVNSLAFLPRGEQPCCFHLNVAGEVAGPLGQLTDGQSRVGDNSLNQSLFCINSTGVIVDNTGKACIITSETTQFQCDEGKAGTPGFSISSSGQLQFHGGSAFIACETGQNGGLNIYTTNSTSVTKCKNVILRADSCASTGSAPVIGIPAAPGANVTVPGGVSPGGAGPGGTGGAGASASPVTIVSTVTVTNCVCSTTEAPGAPGSAAPGASSQTSGAPAGTAPTGTAPTGTAPTGTAPAGTAPAVVPVAPAPTGSAAPSSAASAHTSTVPVTPVPGQSSGASAGTSASAASTTQPSSPCPSCSQSASSSLASGGSSVCPTCSQSAASSGAHTSSVCPPSSSVCPSCPVSTAGPPFANTTRISPAPVTSTAASPSTSIHPLTSVPANATSTTATSTSSATGCPTNLSGEFQFPHLMVRIDSAKPDTPHGTGFNGTVNSTLATTFNFDIPQSYSGKTCSLIFLFPRKEELQTTSFSFSGDGRVAFGKLSQTVTTSTTENNVPSVSQGLGTLTLSPGHSYLVSTFSCPAGQAVAFEMKNAGSTDFEFFEDWNPSPLGLFITVC